MKNRIPVLVSALGLALLAGLSIAATATPPLPEVPAVPAQPAVDAPGAGIRARLAEKLGLTADQQQKIDGLRAARRTELQALDDTKDLAPDAKRDKARAIMDNYRVQMHAVLTPDQQKQADEWRERFAGHDRGAGSGDRPERAGRRGPEMGRPPADPHAIIAMADRIKDRMAEKLQLTDEQRDKLEHLGRAYRAQQRELAKKHHEEMRAVLTPEQQKKAEEMKQHFRPHHGTPGGPAGEQPRELGVNDAPAVPGLAGLDFGPIGSSEEMPDSPPPAPDAS